MSKESKTETINPFTDPRLLVKNLGVWTLLKERKSRIQRIHPREYITQLLGLYEPCRNLFRDAFRLEPIYLTLYFTYQLWISAEPVVLLYFSSSILKAIELSLKGQNPDVHTIGFAVFSHVACVILTSVLKSLDTKISLRLQSTMTTYFEEKFLRSGLNRDLPTALENDSFSHIDGEQAWRTLTEVTGYVASITTAILHVLFVTRSPTLATQSSLFAVVCLLHPIAEMFLLQSWWQQDTIFFIGNPTFKRMKALQKLNEKEFKKDVLSGGMTDYIMSEHTKARESLRGIPTVDVWDMEHQVAVGWQVVLGLLSDLPMLYYAAQAVLKPSDFSMTTVAVLQQSHSALRSNFSRVIGSWSSIRRGVGALKHLYSILDLANLVVTGEREYPNPEEEKSKGMALELRNVSFEYPGSKSSSNALNDVSVSIAPGSLIVVVGSNGSGKSTLVSILTRLYDVTSGTVLVDSHPIHEYNLSDLREATAVLTQDHELFPLSLQENIGMGNSTYVDDEKRVMESAKLGGAADVVAKFKDGMKTILEPVHELYTIMSAGLPNDHPLKNAAQALEKKAEVSGGEKQRIVASRMFMRLASGKIRLVCVDEPSSALDPEAEFQLFNNLRQVREGKTMIFITHRFGHLARYADLILYMKDGVIAESGTHEELMEESGGYAHQYNIQASAFQDNKRQ